MNLYILFVYGNFDTHEEVEFFCNEVLGDSEHIEKIKYVIENLSSIIVIFETKRDVNVISNEISLLLINDYVLYYFMFKVNDLIISHLPEKIKSLIFKPMSDAVDNKIEINFVKNLDIDDLLDKIKTEGIESLTKEEKKFLDNFGN